AIAGIYFVIISDRVPVVGILRHIVFLDRVKPQRGNAEVFDIVKLRENSRQIATMPSPWKGTVDAFLHALYDVVVRIAIDKAIGCNVIDDVALEQSGMATVARRTILTRIGVLERLVSLGERDQDVARFGLRADLQVDKKKSGMRGRWYGRDLDTGI